MMIKSLFSFSNKMENLAFEINEMFNLVQEEKTNSGSNIDELKKQRNSLFTYVFQLKDCDFEKFDKNTIKDHLKILRECNRKRLEMQNKKRIGFNLYLKIFHQRSKLEEDLLLFIYAKFDKMKNLKFSFIDKMLVPYLRKISINEINANNFLELNENVLDESLEYFLSEKLNMFKGLLDFKGYQKNEEIKNEEDIKNKGENKIEEAHKNIYTTNLANEEAMRYSESEVWRNRYEDFKLEKHFERHINKIRNKNISNQYEQAMGCPLNFDIYQNLHFNFNYVFPLFCKANWLKEKKYYRKEKFKAEKKKMTSYFSKLMNLNFILFSHTFKNSDNVGLDYMKVIFLKKEI